MSRLRSPPIMAPGGNRKFKINYNFFTDMINHFALLGLLENYSVAISTILPPFGGRLKGKL